MSKLSVKRIQSIKEPGMHGDGLGLYLNVAPGGTKSWILRVTVKGQTRRQEIGLGGVDVLSLAQARIKAQELRTVAKVGRDPKAKRDKRYVSVEDATKELHELLAPTFRNEKHRAQWLSGLRNHAFQKLGDKNVATVQRQDILEVLSPIWVDMHPTAKRLKQRLEAVFDHAIGKGYRETANPVDGPLQRSLPKGKHKAKHHAALNWQELPRFISQLNEHEGVAAICLRFIILTAARSGEARLATWDEINLAERTWTIPANRMKANEEHRVPLSDEAMTILTHVEGLDRTLIFPSPFTSGGSRPLSVNAFRPLFKRMGEEGMTAHGFRSTFRDWCAEKAHADRQLAEAALAHRVAGVEGAYFRSDLFERRRSLMQTWGQFAAGKTGDIIELARA